MVANILTGFRIVLVIPIIVCIAKGPDRLKAAAAIFLVAAITDFLDGQIARRLKQTSTFGSIFDLVADRILMTPTLIMIAATGVLAATRPIFPLAPVSYVAVVVAADISALFGIYMFTRLRRHEPDVEFPTPTPLAKSAYPLQAMVVFLALLQIKPVAVAAFMYVAAAFTIAAYVSYIKKGGFVFKRAFHYMLAGMKNKLAGSDSEDSNGSEQQERQTLD